MCQIRLHNTVGDWEQGRPFPRIMHNSEPELIVCIQGLFCIQGLKYDNELTPIKRLPTSKASRMHGDNLTQEGNVSEQLTVMKINAGGFAIQLQPTRRTQRHIPTFHRTKHLPAMRYVLPAFAVRRGGACSVSQQCHCIVDALKIGHSSKTPAAIRHGPLELGGLAIIKVRTELRICTLERCAICSGKE